MKPAQPAQLSRLQTVWQRTAVVLLALLVCLPDVSSAETFRSYHVGNSLTWDMKIKFFDRRPTPNFDEAEPGYHIYCSSSLARITEYPSNVCVPPNDYGTYEEGLPNNDWGAITLQPYPGNTGAEELEAAELLINLARQNPNNADTPFFIYATWPTAKVVDNNLYTNLPNSWGNDTDEHGLDTPVKRTQSWVRWFYEELSVRVPDANLLMLPVGDVLLALDGKLRAGAYPELDNASELYRNAGHLNNAGQYLAHITGWAAMYRTNPEGLDWNEGFGTTTPQVPGFPNQDLTPTEELSDLIRTTIWEVLLNDPNSGVTDPAVVPGDFNGDNMTTIADYVAWRDALGQSGGNLPADGILNGIVDSGDYSHWRQHFGSGASGVSATLVPESASGILAVIALASLAFARRHSACSCTPSASA